MRRAALVVLLIAAGIAPATGENLLIQNITLTDGMGGALTLGTDRNDGPAAHREMELLAAAGISTADIIRIATLNGAKFLGKEDQLGSIEEGKLADLVLLDADPIADINNAEKIHAAVIKNGRLIDLNGLSLPGNEQLY